MVVVFIAIEIFTIGCDLCRVQFAAVMRQAEHLMAAEFDGAGFVNGNMSGICCKDSLMPPVKK